MTLSLLLHFFLYCGFPYLSDLFVVVFIFLPVGASVWAAVVGASGGASVVAAIDGASVVGDPVVGKAVVVATLIEAAMVSKGVKKGLK